jgi:hypothetical protein
VHGAYGKTEGSERIFVWLEQHRRSPAWGRWLQSHPDAGDRVERLRTEAKKLGAGSGK